MEIRHCFLNSCLTESFELTKTNETDLDKNYSTLNLRFCCTTFEAITATKIKISESVNGTSALVNRYFGQLLMRKLLQLSGCLLQKASFSSFQRCPIGFGSGLIL